MIRGQFLSYEIWRSFFAEAEVGRLNRLGTGERDPLVLKARVGGEINKDAELVAAGVKVVMNLGAVFREKRRDSLELHNDGFVAEKIGSESVFEFRFLVKNWEINLRLEWNTACGELDFQSLLIGGLGESGTKLIVHLKAGPHDFVGFLLEEHFLVLDFHSRGFA